MESFVLSKVLHRFQPNFANNRDHRVIIVGGPNTRPTNPRWRRTPSWKSQKSLSRQRFDRCVRNSVQWCKMVLLTTQTVKKFYFKNPSWRTAAILTRSSAIAVEGPRDASCQLKSCQLPRNSAAKLLVRQVLNKSKL